MESVSVNDFISAFGAACESRRIAFTQKKPDKDGSISLSIKTNMGQVFLALSPSSDWSFDDKTTQFLRMAFGKHQKNWPDQVKKLWADHNQTSQPQDVDGVDHRMRMSFVERLTNQIYGNVSPWIGQENPPPLHERLGLVEAIISDARKPAKVPTIMFLGSSNTNNFGFVQALRAAASGDKIPAVRLMKDTVIQNSDIDTGDDDMSVKNKTPWGRGEFSKRIEEVLAIPPSPNPLLTPDLKDAVRAFKPRASKPRKQPVNPATNSMVETDFRMAAERLVFAWIEISENAQDSTKKVSESFLAAQAHMKSSLLGEEQETQLDNKNTKACNRIKNELRRAMGVCSIKDDVMLNALSVYEQARGTGKNADKVAVARAFVPEADRQNIRLSEQQAGLANAARERVLSSMERALKIELSLS